MSEPFFGSKRFDNPINERLICDDHHHQIMMISRWRETRSWRGALLCHASAAAPLASPDNQFVRLFALLCVMVCGVCNNAATR
jgi:hypothetical protein